MRFVGLFILYCGFEKRRTLEPRRRGVRSGIVWPNRDPIQEEGGIDLYTFSGNDAIDRWDLFGLCYIHGRYYDDCDREFVKICFRPAEIVGSGFVAAFFGKEHSWAKTPYTESGQGKAGGGVPGQPGGGWGYPGVPTTMNNHAGQSIAKNAICVPVAVKVCCFESKIALGTPKGRWWPLINDCNTVMENAVNSCGGNWDKVQ